MPALSRSYEHKISSYTCASNVFSIFDINGNTQNIPFTITEATNYFYEDIKDILTTAGMVEAFDDTKKIIKILGQEYTFVVINNLDRAYATAWNVGPVADDGKTEVNSTPIPVVFRNGQTWVNYEAYAVNNNSHTSDTNYQNGNASGGYGVGSIYGARGNSTATSSQYPYNVPDTYYHPILTLYGNRVIRECIRRTGRTTYNGNSNTGNRSDFRQANFPLQSLKHSIRYDTNDYRYCLNCYYNTNFVLLTYSTKVSDYSMPLCFMAKGMDQYNKNIHYFSGDPSSATPLSTGSTGAADTISWGTNSKMSFSSYIPTLLKASFWSNCQQRLNNIQQKAYNLHNLISLDESEMKEIDGHKVYHAITEHQTSPGLIFNTYDNFTDVDLVKRYVPKTINEQYRMPLNLKHNYGHFDNIYYTSDMSLGYNNFYEINGETYYLVGHDYRTDYNYYYYNVLLKM